MDADLCVVSRAVKIVCVSAGLASIARVTARIPTAVRIPVFCAVVLSNECLEVLAVSAVRRSSIVDFSGANSLIVNCNILFFSAGLIDGEDPV